MRSVRPPQAPRAGRRPRDAFADLTYAVDGAIAIITLKRPQKLNAMRLNTFQELDTALRTAAAAEAVRCVILTGYGENFSSGADLKEMQILPWRDCASWFPLTIGAPFRTMQQFRKPIICAIRGYAVAGGAELALASHIRVAGHSAKFALSEILRGHLPGAGGTVRLHPLIGAGRALYYLLTGEMIDAERAERYGLVNSVVADDKVMTEALRIARHLASLSQSSVRGMLALAATCWDAPLGARLELENAIGQTIAFDPDFHEGLDAFAAKREPSYNRPARRTTRSQHAAPARAATRPPRRRIT